MASLRRHPRSPYWYLRRFDSLAGRWVETSTGHRADSIVATRQAQKQADKATAQEARERDAAGATGNIDKAAFEVWVPQWMAEHFAGRDSVFRRQSTSWSTLRTWLREIGIRKPREIRYRHAQEFLAWRREHAVHGRPVSHNTALLELHFLSQIMGEAIRRELAESNPLANARIPRQQPKQKRELTDDDIAAIRAAVAHRAPWARRAIEIALYTGCRWAETGLLPEQIDLDRGMLTIRDAKRKDTDRRKHFTVPIHSELRPILQEFVASGDPVAVRVSREHASRLNAIMQEAAPGATFHCLRVTFITRCHRANLTDREAMALVNHSSGAVHSIYSRLRGSELASVQARISLPTRAK